MQIFKTHTHASKWLPKVPPRDPVWPTRIGKKETSGDGIEAAPGQGHPTPAPNLEDPNTPPTDVDSWWPTQGNQPLGLTLGSR